MDETSLESFVQECEEDFPGCHFEKVFFDWGHYLLCYELGDKLSVAGLRVEK